MHIDLTVLFSGIAVIISVIAVIVSYISAGKTRIIEIRPVLAFFFNSGSGWSVRNIGNGPALNIVLALLDLNEKWVSPKRIPSLAVGGEFLINEFSTQIEFIGWGCLYTDFSARPYSSTHKGKETKIHTGFLFPVWKSDEIN